MKTLTLMAVIFFATSGFAATSVIKTCSTTFPGIEPGQQSIATKIEILSDGKSMSAKVTQDGQSYDDIAEVNEQSVRADIPTDMESPSLDELNLAEKLISHAIVMSTDPLFEGKFSAGLDLSKVRSAKLYIVGEQTNMGAPAIVEAKDESGAVLGSFLGGFFVTPCE